MRLGFGRPGSYGCPGKEFGNILGNNRIQHLAACGKAQFIDAHQQAPSSPKPPGNIIGAVHARIYDQPSPTERRAGFFEINAHNDKQRIRILARKPGQPIGILEGSLGVVDGTGTDDG